MPRYRNPTVLSCSDFQLFLHDELRSRELERAPEGARTVLHGGAAGRWYFDWFESCYPTDVERHIGVEAFLPEPDDLPENVEWLPRTLGDLEPVGTGEVDLVYAGEVIEHLWPEDVVGFLLESNRVLRPGGALALDSPNREVTGLAGWEHAEHTVEFTSEEVRELLRLAGFDDVLVRGIWLAYDREAGRVLKLETLEPDGEWTLERRRDEAAGRPEDSFLWWAEGRKGDRAPARKRIERLVSDAYRAYRGRRFSGFQSNVGQVSDRVVTTAPGEAGHLVFGPYVPVRGGRWAARFEVGLVPGAEPLEPEESIGTLDVTKELDVRVITSRELLAGELPDEGLAEVELPFELTRTEMGVQLRFFGNGRAGLRARLGAEIHEQADLESAAVPEEQDFNEFLHELRSRELERLPGGARTVLHGGAAGAWYFEWFDERYPTPVERHIGVEAFSPPPDPLPPRVQWLQRTLGDLSPVPDASVDLVFAGEVLEHLWPEDAAGFLAEAHRVLAPGGTIALDSPNRAVTTKLGWDHPEHTVEFTVEEVRELLELAGFDDVAIRGVWISYDAERDRVLPFDELGRVAGWDAERRAAEASSRPEDSFVWWAEAKRSGREPDREALNRRVHEAYDIYRSRRLSRMHHTVGSQRERDGRKVVTGRRGEAGYLLFGPYVPMRSGEWVARFRIAANPAHWRGNPDPDEPFGSLDIMVGEADPRVVAARTLTARDLPLDGEEHELELPFELERTEFGAQFRVHTLGRVRMSARYPVEVE